MHNFIIDIPSNPQFSKTSTPSRSATLSRIHCKARIFRTIKAFKIVYYLNDLTQNLQIHLNNFENSMHNFIIYICTFESTVFENFDTQQECNFEQNTLQSPNGDMINGAGAEFSVKFFGAKTAKVNNVVRPQVENVISTIPIAFLNNNNFCTWKKKLDKY